MPKKFTQTEKEYINKRLKEAAKECLVQYGVKRTTVDELVRRVNIPKGTFYLFYESKEILLFEVINEIHDEIQRKLLRDVIIITSGLTIDNLTDFLYQLYQVVNETGLMELTVNGELELLMRKLPEEIVKDHLEKDDDIMKQLMEALPLKKSINIEVFSGAFRAIFLTMLHRREIGDNVYDETLKLLLRGMVIQLMEEE